MFSSNIYYVQISSLSNNSKYLKWYLDITYNAKSRANSKKEANKIIGYNECHHIVPKCFCYGSKSKFSFLELPKDHNDNLAYLTAREHFICHILLVKMLKDKKLKHVMSSALNRLKKSKNNQNAYYNSRTYEVVKKLLSKYHHNKLEENKLKLKTPSPHKGKTYEQIYGIEKANELKKIRSSTFKTSNRFGKNNSRFDSTIYTFYNQNLNLTFISTRYEFYNKFSLHKGEVCKIIGNRKFQHRGWKVIYPEQ